MKRTRRANSGFTLIEILISLVLLMVGIVGILSLFRFTFCSFASSRKLCEIQFADACPSHQLRHAVDDDYRRV